MAMPTAKISAAEEENEEDMDTLPGGARFGELGKLTPVMIVVATIVFLYFEYVYIHCLRLLQLDLPTEAREQDEVMRAYVELAIFHVVTGLLLYCFAKCMLTFPGTIPDSSMWDVRQDTHDQYGIISSLALVEEKQSGGRRECKWCHKFKPDRTHHCRICNTCVLRMDHHCPWVYNCVGFRNHKYFFLLVLYATIDLWIVSTTMCESVWWATRTDVSLEVLFLLATGETYAMCVTSVISLFFIFHIWLMVKAMTTLELCEKQAKRMSGNVLSVLMMSASIYSCSTYENICSVLGPSPLLWLLPCGLPTGDGVTFKMSQNTPRASMAAAAAAMTTTASNRGSKAPLHEGAGRD